MERARNLMAADLDRFEKLLDRMLDRQTGYITESERAMYRGGKKIRPLLLVLSGRLAGPASEPPLPLAEKVIQAAVSLEMLHVATLIHDDIVDVAPTRRGLPTVSDARGTEQAVLMGDLQFIEAVRGFANAIDTQKDMALVSTVLESGFRICCGEIDEIRTDPRLEQGQLRLRYMRTIDRKTAVLFSLACESGASLVGAGEKATWYLSSYGRAVGRSFQIMDDLLDLVRSDGAAGKRQNSDIRARRLSLPVIYAMGVLGPRSRVFSIMTGGSFTEEDVDAANREVVSCSGFERAYADARRYVIEAARTLEAFPPSPYRKVLRDLAFHIVDRGFEEPGP